MQHSQNLLNSDMALDQSGITAINETQKWCRFLGITGIVFSIFIALGGLFSGLYMRRLGEMPGSPGINIFGAMPAVFIIGLYLFLALLGFVLSIQLYRFGTRIKTALATSDTVMLNAGLQNLKLFFRIYGIVMIIYLAFLALAMIGGIFTALAR